MITLSSTLPSLVHPHPTSRLYQRRLDRGVRVLQAMLEGGVLGAFEPVDRVPLQHRQLAGQAREVACHVPGHVLRVLRSHLRAEHPTPQDRRYAPDSKVHAVRATPMTVAIAMAQVRRLSYSGQCFHALPLADSLASQEFVHVGLGVAQERGLCPHPRDPVRVVYDLVVPSDKLRLSKISQLLDLVPLPEEKTRILPLLPGKQPLCGIAYQWPYKPFKSLPGTRPTRKLAEAVRSQPRAS
jgi:hypothetical protein